MDESQHIPHAAPLSQREGQAAEGLGVSILIPTYNYVCAHLVCELQKQCEEVQAMYADDFHYEIIVADDGSNDMAAVEKNAAIEYLPNSRYEILDNNIGRAAIRNWLVNAAKYRWLILMDCDAEVIRDDFVLRYWQAILEKTEQDPEVECIFIGGTATPTTCSSGCELRHRYELAASDIRTLEARRSNPSMYFSTFNFLCSRYILRQIPFDERCTEYGYEDALFGIEAERLGFEICHIDNELLHVGINDNQSFLRNSEAALRTLYKLGKPMTERANVSRVASKFTSTPLRRTFLKPLLLILYKMSKPFLRKNLLSSAPNLKIFAFYKLGYYISLK